MFNLSVNEIGFIVYIIGVIIAFVITYYLELSNGRKLFISALSWVFIITIIILLIYLAVYGTELEDDDDWY